MGMLSYLPMNYILTTGLFLFLSSQETVTLSENESRIAEAA